MHPVGLYTYCRMIHGAYVNFFDVTPCSLVEILQRGVTCRLLLQTLRNFYQTTRRHVPEGN